jgi:hypothetical protein
MKLILFAFLLALTSNSFAKTCPDMSGTYLQKHSSCRGNFESHSGWPLRNLETLVTIVQDKCNSLTISYPDTRASNTPLVTVKINFAEAVSFSSNNNSIKAKFFEPSSRVDAMFGTIKASIADKVKFELEGTSISIISSSLMKGFINYVIPVLDYDSFNCHLEKI